MHRKRSVILVLFLVTLISTLGLPVRAWSDIGEEWVDEREIEDGTWSLSTWTATEDSSPDCSFLGYLYIYYIDTGADVYKVRVDYDSWWVMESLTISYRWGTSGSFTDICETSLWPGDAEYTISDATSSTLTIRLRDAVSSDDPTQNAWDFGHEMYLIMYWY